MLTIFLQNIFFSLFDSATKVTLYFFTTSVALFANAFLLLRSHAAGARARFPFKARLLRGTLIALVTTWSIWAFVSSIASVSIIGYGLPLLWLTYTIGNGVNLACSTSSVVAFIRRLSDSGAIPAMPRLLVAIDDVATLLAAPFTIVAIVLGLWTTAYTVLYTLGILVL